MRGGEGEGKRGNDGRGVSKRGLRWGGVEV